MDRFAIGPSCFVRVLDGLPHEVLRRAALVVLVTAALSSGCRRNIDPGDVDRISKECLSADWPPADGGLTWSSAAPAAVAALQSTTWQRLSSDPDCQTMSPPPLQHQLSWHGPDATQWSPGCDPPITNEKSDFSTMFLSDVGAGTAFFDAAGKAAVVLGGTNEYYGAPVRDSNSFLFASHSFKQPWCTFLRAINNDFSPGSATVVASDPDFVEVVRNPLGGYVQIRYKNDGALTDAATSASQLRWVNDDLRPLGNWHTAFIIHGLRHNLYLRVFVDRRGRALALSFVSPPSFGAPAPPSDWAFSARWMDRDGPLTDEFQPPAPEFTAPDGTILFSNWGSVVPLQEGGFAMFQIPAPAWTNGTISPVGWYAFYPSGERPTTSVPDWLRSYDGSLQLVAKAKAYAAIRQDPGTCKRTVVLIAPSGRACFALPVEGSENCDWKNTIAADGTLALQDNCQFRWWPRLAWPSP